MTIDEAKLWIDNEVPGKLMEIPNFLAPSDIVILVDNSNSNDSYLTKIEPSTWNTDAADKLESMPFILFRVDFKADPNQLTLADVTNIQNKYGYIRMDLQLRGEYTTIVGPQIMLMMVNDLPAAGLRRVMVKTMRWPQ